MSVPAHDQRDFEFAQKYNLPVRPVVFPVIDSQQCDFDTQAYTEKGVLNNSGEWDGLNSEDAFTAISETIEKQGRGERRVNFPFA